MKKRLSVKDCKNPWNNLQILVNGEVRVCCWMAKSLGNLNEKTLAEIWGSEKLKELRDHISRNEVHPYCHNAPCPFIQRLVVDEE